jgi:hypothetical protein
MPYTPAQRRFFGLCYSNPEKAKKKCPSKADAHRMLEEGVKKKKK